MAAAGSGAAMSTEGEGSGGAGGAGRAGAAPGLTRPVALQT